MKELKVLVLASGAHAHLSEQDLKALFGPDAVLNVKKMLGDGTSGQFVSDKKVEILGPKGSRMLSVLGPLRKETQIELSYTEARPLGMRPPVADSGKLDGTMGCTLVGPAGRVELEKGVMVARRHIHMKASDANEYGFQDKDMVKVRTEGERGLVFDQCLIRVSEKGRTVMHVDYDEMNAAGMEGDGSGFAYKD